MSGIVDFETQIENKAGEKINPATEDSIGILKSIVRLIRPLSIISSANRLSVDVASLPTLANVTTVATVTNLNQLAGISTFDLMRSASRTAYNTGIRSNIT